jgi:endonuclease/exonuclease/phosphatase family metal-dependent hydrolase
MKLRVLTWNIHKGIGGIDRRYSLERVAEVIREADPDVAVLQEVADGWPPAACEIQAERLTEMTDLSHFAFAPEHRFKVGGYGNAILSRYPILDRFRLDLKIGWRKQRSALQARVLLPGDERRTCVVTNLHLGLAETERREQLRLLFESEQMMSHEEPAVIAGDLNDVFGGLEKRFFSERGFCRAVERARSFPAYSPFFSLDGIFIRGFTKNHGSVLRTPQTRFASDHLPLLSEIVVTGL